MTWCSWHGGVRSQVGVGDPRGFFQPNRFYDSVSVSACLYSYPRSEGVSLSLREMTISLSKKSDKGLKIALFGKKLSLSSARCGPCAAQTLVQLLTHGAQSPGVPASPLHPKLGGTARARCDPVESTGIHRTPTAPRGGEANSGAARWRLRGSGGATRGAQLRPVGRGVWGCSRPRRQGRRQRRGPRWPPAGTQCCPAAPARPIARCCHGGAKMAALAYTGGKREINYYFSVRSAKALALGAVLLLTACHAASRRYRGEGAAAGAPRGAAAAGRGRRSPGGAPAEPRHSSGTAAVKGGLRVPPRGQPRRAGAGCAAWRGGSLGAEEQDPGGQRRRARPGGRPRARRSGEAPRSEGGERGRRGCGDGVRTESPQQLRGPGLRQVKLQG